MAGGPSHLETLRLQAGAEGARRQAVPRVVHEGPAARAAPEHDADRPRAVRRVRTSTARAGRRSPTLFPHIGQDRRRHLHRPVDGDRADQPRPGPGVHEHRLDPQGPAEHGLVARSTASGPRPTACPGFIVLMSPDARAAAAAGLGPAVVERVPAEPVPGHPVPVQGRRGPLRRQPAGRVARARSGRWSTRSSGSTACSPRTGTTRRSQTRISQYEMAFKMQTRVPELTDFASEPQDDARPVRREAARRRQLRLQLPARPPAGRARRAVHPALPPRLGPPRRHRDGHADRGARRPTRPAPALVQDLKQRGMLDDTLVIWGGEFGRTPMGQGTGRDHHINAFSHVDGRRRHQGRHHLRRDRRTRLPRRSRTSSRCATCTRRCCTCCGIDHERFTVKFQGLDAKLTGVERRGWSRNCWPSYARASPAAA